MIDDRFRLLFENSLDAIVIANDEGTYLDVNRAACDLFGFTRAQMLRMKVGDLATPMTPGAADQYSEYLDRGSAKGEFTFVRSDGQTRVASYSACRLSAGQHLSILRDVTEQKQAQEALRREHEFSEAALDSLPGVFYVIDADKRFQRWNHNLARVSGYTVREIGQLQLTDLFVGDDKQTMVDWIREGFERGTASVRADLVARHGTRTPYFFTGRRTRLAEMTCLVGMGIDVSEQESLGRQLREQSQALGSIANDNAQLSRAEQERTEQLRLAISEVHHRVKNSLQSVGALLEMQIPDEGLMMPVEAVQDSLSQIKTIALVHDLLARDKPIGSVDAARVLTNLGRLLSTGMSAGRQQVNIQVDAEPVEMATKIATSLALVVNELLTNAAKHQGAAAESGDYVISVTMRRMDDLISIAVQNPGPGFPAHFDSNRHAGVGLQLVRTLVEHDLRGRVTFSNVPDPAQPGVVAGARVEFSFPAAVCSED